MGSTFKDLRRQQAAAAMWRDVESCVNGRTEWTAATVAAYLEYHGIGIVIERGEPNFQKPATMPRKVFVDHVSLIGVHARRFRMELLALYGPPEPPEVRSHERNPRKVYPDTPPALARVILCANVFEWAEFFGCRIAGYCPFTYRTCWLGVGAKVLPPNWSMACLDIRDGGWVSLPNAKPPPKWKEPANWVIPAHWCPPKGFVYRPRPRKRGYNPWSHEKPKVWDGITATGE